MKFEKYKVIGVFAFLIIPIVFFKKIEFKDWVIFLGSYIGAGISGGFALIAVNYQLVKAEKYKTKGILESLKYTLKKNLEIKNKLEIYYVFSYTIENWWLYNYKENFYEIFNKNIFNNDYKELVKLQFYQEIDSIKRNLEEIEKDYVFLNQNLSKKITLLINLKEEIEQKYKIETDNKVRDYLKKIYKLANFLYALSIPLFTLISVKNYLPDSKIDIEKKLEDLKKYYVVFYIDKNDIKYIFEENKNIEWRVKKLTELINYSSDLLVKEIFSSIWGNKIEANIEELYFYTSSERNLLENLKGINEKMENLKVLIENELSKFS